MAPQHSNDFKTKVVEFVEFVLSLFLTFFLLIIQVGSSKSRLILDVNGLANMPPDTDVALIALVGTLVAKFGCEAFIARTTI